MMNKSAGELPTTSSTSTQRGRGTVEKLRKIEGVITARLIAKT